MLPLNFTQSQKIEGTRELRHSMEESPRENGLVHNTILQVLPQLVIVLLTYNFGLRSSGHIRLLPRPFLLLSTLKAIFFVQGYLSIITRRVAL